MPPNTADVRVKYKANQTPQVTYQDKDGNGIGKLEVHADTVITFGIASGSDAFMFNYCYVSPDVIDPCPSGGETPSNPAEFVVSPTQPFSASTFTLEDKDLDTSSGGTTYYYTIKFTPVGGVQQWADPQIVNYPQ
jgi:hypothetical protein